MKYELWLQNEFTECRQYFVNLKDCIRLPQNRKTDKYKQDSSFIIGVHGMA